MKTGIIYTRVSSKKQNDNGTSPQDQEKACREYCAQHGIKPIGVYKEVFTGKKVNRPVLNEAIKSAELNKVDFFIIYDIDRISRQGYDIYSELKQKLNDKGIILKDYKNIIGDITTVIKNPLVDMEQYKWNTENPSEYAEVMISTQAKMESKKMLQRTIGKEILLEQNGYHTRESNFGFKNKKIQDSHFGKVPIQVRDSEEGPWMEAIYHNLAKNTYSDKEVVEIINNMGYKSREGNKLTVKQMQVYIKRPIYAGIKVAKWTGYKPLKQKYDGLVSIEVWNKANKGKKIIKENSDGSIEILYSKGNIQSETPIIQRRKKFDPQLPYRSLVLSSKIPGKLISGGVSTGKGGKYSYYYPCRKKGVVGENIKKVEFEDLIEDFFRRIEIKPALKEIFAERFEKIFDSNKKDLFLERDSLIENLRNKKTEYKKLENSILSANGMQRILESLNQKMDTIKKEEANIHLKLQDINNSNILESSNFKKFSFYIIEHLGELLRKSQNLEELQVVFQFVFPKTPEYDKLVMRTQKVYPIFSLNSKKELPKIESSSLNLQWQDTHG